MNLNNRIVILLISLLAVACASKPKLDYDTHYDFSQLQQFTTQPPQNITDPLSARRIESAIDTSLTAQGFIKTTDSPQFSVTYSFKVEDKPKSSGLSIGLGSGSWGSSGGISVGTSVGVPLGSDSNKIQLIQIDIIDLASNRLIWRGSDKFDFSDGGVEKASETQQTVSKILALFPPKPTP
ncbi:DUF4136 domain-containing protein [Shewanella psychrotolerans]|uniref:DUF4136 domain-containing protein n=1 Tax=Shewanella psychrotolerans TaxID=2864206 RepID=UPI001C6603F0|nr:DUF4136 domain-containing protein [Shewanella psychrotolerans]QYK02177.1 DUF4136 domain-containing protein [Shewanella psychrotolerans]